MSRSLVFASAISLGFTVSTAAEAQTSVQTQRPVEAQAPVAAQAETSAEPAPAPARTPEGRPDSPPPEEGSAADASSDEVAAEPEVSAEAAGSLQEEPGPGDNVVPSEASPAPSPEMGILSGEAEEMPPAPYDGPATLLDGDGERMHIGGYGGITVLGTSIHRSGGLLVGGEGALLLDHRLALGFAGYGLASEVRGPDFANGDASILGFGYGGAVFRYHLVSKRSPVTASVGTLIGAGGLTLIQKVESEYFDYDYDYEEDTAANAFFVAEPSVQVNLHLTKWMRFGVSGGYRFARGPSLRGISDGDLEGVTAGGHAQFGWF